MSIYSEWGFNENPFETKPLPPSEDGENLLVDRKLELRKIITRLSSTSNIITIEGSNGVGKTSLVNIAAFEMYRDYLIKHTGDFFIPCDQQFQLTPEKSSIDFADEVLMTVAETLINRAKSFVDKGYDLKDNKYIAKWLNSPLVSSYNGNVGTSFFGIGFGKSTEANTSTGFQRMGFRTKILDWLKEIFPFGTNGGVVCVIDNLELLQTSGNARKHMEELRDTLFSYTGLRWVLCGSLGIVNGVASSPRMKGRLLDPIEVLGIDSEFAAEIFDARAKALELKTGKGYLPLSGEDFKLLYRILNNNTRNALSHANDYCLWVADEELCPNTKDEKSALFLNWLEMTSTRKVNSVRTQIKPRTFSVFKKSIKIGGAFSPSDFEIFGFNTLQAMRPHISLLEESRLVTSSIDESDKRRKTIQVTAEGWLFNYGLKSDK